MTGGYRTRFVAPVARRAECRLCSLHRTPLVHRRAIGEAAGAVRDPAVARIGRNMGPRTHYQESSAAAP
jgi:hypothetical protein